MLIRWASDGYGRALAIPTVVVSSDVKDLSMISKGKMLMIQEGWNEIPKEHWEAIAPSIKDKIESGQIELRCKRGKDDEGNETMEQQELNEVRADYAREIIKGCFNIDNLKAWLQDTRLTAELRNLIDIQLESCLEGVEKGKRTR